MNHRTSRLAGAAILTFVAILAGACTSNDDETTAGTAAGLCGRACERVNGCDPFVAKASCENHCVDAHAATFAKMRPEVVDGARACFSARPCPLALARDFVGACIEEHAGSEAPSADASSFCETWKTWADACGAEIDPPSCLRGAKRFRDDALVEAKSCFAQGCASTYGCLKAQLGDLEIFATRAELPEIPGEEAAPVPLEGCGTGYECSPATSGECTCMGGSTANRTCCRPGFPCASGAPDCETLCRC